MLTLNYFLMKMPGKTGKYVPNTRTADKYKVKEFLLYLSRKNRSIPVNTYSEVFKTMTDAVEDILSQGDAITIPGFIRIAPVVKGVFDSESEPFRETKHGIGVNCTVLPSFIKKVRNRIRLKRIKTPDRYPSITRIRDNITKSNVIRKEGANRISGVFLNLKRLEFAGFTVASETIPDKRIIIENKDIELIALSRSEMIYVFRRSFVTPGWLEDGAQISLRLRYKKKDGHISDFSYFKTKWVS